MQAKVPNTIQLITLATLVPDTTAAQRLLINNIANVAGDIADLVEMGIQHPILKAMRGVIAT